MTQTNSILDYLKTGKSITPLEALDRFGCFRLGARILDIKHLGWDIDTEIVEQNGKRFASYSIRIKESLF
jgi:hypothetical protein